MRGLNDSRRFAHTLRREAVSDDVLCARVHSKIGRYSSHPGAIEVAALDGRVQTSRPPTAPRSMARP